MHILLYFLLTLHVLVCVLMVLVVLMQRPRSEGLGAAFGSGMTENIFGAQTTNVLAKFTTWLGGAFFVLTLALAVLYSHLNSRDSSVIDRDLMSRPEPKSAPANTAPTAVKSTPAPAAAPATTSAPAATPAAAQPVAPLAPATPPAAPAPAKP